MPSHTVQLGCPWAKRTRAPSPSQRERRRPCPANLPARPLIPPQPRPRRAPAAAMAKAGTIRGLQVFISDIRACPNRESEARRVDKELAKIRAKFGDDKKTLSAYDRKKYVWKLLYIYMLGYDVEFGHKQACDLIPAQK